MASIMARFISFRGDAAAAADFSSHPLAAVATPLLAAESVHLLAPHVLLLLHQLELLLLLLLLLLQLLRRAHAAASSAGKSAQAAASAALSGGMMNGPPDSLRPTNSDATNDV